MFIILLFIIGLFFGSFYGVIIYRVPKNESILFPSSHCNHCRKKLAFYDMIPVISYIMLDGKCRYCHVPVPFSYPVIELLTGIAFAYSYFLPHPNIFFLLYHIFILSILIIIFFTDLWYGMIPFFVMLPSLVLSFGWLIFATPALTLSHVLAGIGAALIFLIFYFIKGMGFGDVVFVLWMGFILGFPNIIVGIYLAFVFGALLSLLLVARSKFTIKDAIPFGPFLVAGTFIALTAGQRLLSYFFIFRP